jgi:hypothetical protein
MSDETQDNPYGPLSGPGQPQGPTTPKPVPAEQPPTE